MATMQGPFPGSASHRELCKRNFTSRVLPHLQERVRDVFEKNFADSYALIRSLSHEPGEYQFGIALSAIGIRAFDRVEPQMARFLERNAGRLIALGMGYRKLRSGNIEVFKYSLVGPMLSPIVGTLDTSMNSIEIGLERFAALDRKKYPYDLLIWSSFIPPGKYDEFTVLDMMTSIDQRYHVAAQIPVQMTGLVSTFMLGATAAVALVQQIRGSTSEGIRRAGLEM